MEEAIDLPFEIQRIIFEIAAHLNGRCAHRLILVAKYVHDWIYPILYERIVIRDQKAAIALLRSAQAHSVDHFRPLAKSLTVGKQIPQKFIKPIFAKLTRGINSFTIFRDALDSAHLLQYVRSRLIRRLTLVYLDTRGRQHEIPIDISSSISHLALITNTPYGGFSMHRSIEVASAMQRNDTAWLDRVPFPIPSLPPFHRLSFIAISYGRWRTAFSMLTLAHELKCFAVLFPTNSSMQNISHGIMTIKITKDPRVIILTRYGHPLDWDVEDGFAPSDFWTTLEDLSRKKCICDDGERWDEHIINDFRARHPGISLLGD